VGGKTNAGRNKNKKKKRKKRRERQFDLFIDGRSFFDLPRLDESGRNLVATGPAEPPSWSCGGSSSRFGSYGREERTMSKCQRNDDQEDGGGGDDIIEEWTADSGAIADGPSGNGNHDDDDDDSVDGFMDSIDLGPNLDQRGDDGRKKSTRSSTGTTTATTTSTMRRTKEKIGSVKTLQVRSGRAAAGNKIGTSTKHAVAITSRRAEEGVRRLKAGTTRVLSSPIVLMRRGGLVADDEEGIGSGVDTSDEDRDGASGGGGDGVGGGSNGTEEAVHRLAPEDYPSFHTMHRTIMRQQNSTGDGSAVPREEFQEREENEGETADQTIDRLRDQITHLELEIANNDHRVAADVERSVAVAEIEARMLQMVDKDEISRLRVELEELRSTASQSERLGMELVSAYEELERELVAAKSEAERLKESAEEAREEAQSLKADRAATEEEIRRLEQRVIHLQQALDAARAKKPRSRGGAPFVPNDATTSYLDDPKCCLCSKDATENMRDCQCGQESCDLRAHGSCLIGSKHNPSPSVSHPGTPAPALPLILCGGIFKK